MACCATAYPDPNAPCQPAASLPPNVQTAVPVQYDASTNCYRQLMPAQGSSYLQAAYPHLQ
eukprot:7378441-Prymnesium_polylepis.1